MLSKVSQFFAKNVVLTLALWIFLLVFGSLAYTSWLPREGFPAVEVPTAIGSGQFFEEEVLTPDEVDAQIKPLVEALAARPEVKTFNDKKRVASFARPNSFQLTVELKDGFTSAKSKEIIDEEYAKLDMPQSLEFRAEPLNLALLLGKYDLLVGVRGPADATAEELTEISATTLEAYTNQQGIAAAEVYPLSFQQEGTNQTVQSGFNQLTSLNDSAKVFNPAATVGIVASDGYDSIELRAETEKAVDEINASSLLPEGYETFVAFDYAPQIEEQIGSLQGNVITGILAVALIALLVISWRASVIAALFIVTVMATSLGILYLVGITLNTISLFGIILALGLFVDDAIVITEAIDTFKKKGESYLETIGSAINKVGSASVSGTITTILVFAPMLAITGVLGKFIKILPISVMIALAVSLVLSLVLIPFASRFLTINAPESKNPILKLEKKVAHSLASVIGHTSKGTTFAAIGVAISIVMTAVGIGVFAPNVKFNIFPPQKDSIDLSITVSDFKGGESVEEANALIQEINQKAADALGEDLISGYLYDGNERLSFGAFRLTPIGGREKAPDLVADLLDPIEEEYADRARVDFAVVSAGPPEEVFPFKMQIFSEDAQVLENAATQISSELSGKVLDEGKPSEYTVLETKVVLDSLSRNGGKRFAQIEARFDGDEVTALTQSTQKYLEEKYPEAELTALGLSADALEFDFGFESQNQESFNSMPLAFGFALLAMLVLLIIQFRSSAQWLLVFLAIPFSMFGVFGGLWLTGNNLSFFVMLGLLGLMGIAVNNTILLVDFANQQRVAGADRVTAIQEAVRMRFRPLVATSLTTVFGLLPLALSDPFWEALGFTIIFGLLSSTFLVLVSFPFYYLGMEWLRDRYETPWRREALRSGASTEYER